MFDHTILSSKTCCLCVKIELLYCYQCIQSWVIIAWLQSEVFILFTCDKHEDDLLCYIVIHWRKENKKTLPKTSLWDRDLGILFPMPLKTEDETIKYHSSTCHILCGVSLFVWSFSWPSYLWFFKCEVSSENNLTKTH